MLEELNQKIGDKIRILRQSNDYKQETVAEQLGMSLSGYAKIERGEVELGINRLKQIADFYKVKSSFLLDEQDKNVYNIQQNEIFNANNVAGVIQVQVNHTGAMQVNTTDILNKRIDELEQKVNLILQKLTFI